MVKNSFPKAGAICASGLIGSILVLALVGCEGRGPSGHEGSTGRVAQRLAPPGSFPITIDATALSQSALSAQHPYDDTVVDTSAPREIDLVPNTYVLSPFYGVFDGVLSYTVTSTGTIDYDPNLEGILTGRGSTTLTVHGVSISLDATALTQDALRIATYGGNLFDAHKLTSLTVLPGNGYRLDLGPYDALSDLQFDVDVAGNVTVAPQYQPAATSAQSLLVLSGQQVQIDAPVSGPQVFLAYLWPSYSTPLSTTQTNTVTLMPLLPDWGTYAFYLGNDVLATLQFNVDELGHFVYDPQFETYVHGAGTSELTLAPPQITVNVSSPSLGTYYLGGLSTAGYFPYPSTQVFSLLPNVDGYDYWFSGAGLTLPFYVNADGTLRYDDPPAGLSVAGIGTASLSITSHDVPAEPPPIAPPPTTILSNSGGASTRPPLGGPTLSVSDSGDARYHIPVWSPPGRADVEPSLSLEYSSASGNSLTGMGWALSGLSRITRCRGLNSQGVTAPPVVFDSSDTFCLDGDRLVPAADGTLRKFHDDFSRTGASVSDQYGPTSFTRQTQDGRIYTYGTNEGSLGFVQGQRTSITPDPNTGAATSTTSTVRLAWVLTRVADRVGNYMTITYQQSAGGDLLPSRIDYTASTTLGSSRHVDFVYDQTRPDIDQYYVAGLSFTRPDRLVRIEAYAPSSAAGGVTALIRTMSFGYEQSLWTQRSLLTKATECDGLPPGTDGATATPLCRETDLSYSTGPNVFDDYDQDISGLRLSNGYPSTDNTPSPQLTVLDVDGDGNDDLLYETTATSTYHLRLSTGAGLGPDVDTQIAISQDTAPFTTGPHALDFNGDGHTDILVSTGTKDAPRNEIHLAIPLGTTWILDSTPIIPAAIVGARQVDAADLDGDRFPDLVIGPPGDYGTISYVLNHNGNFSAMGGAQPFDQQGTGVHLFADINGDGRTDLLSSGNVFGGCGTEWQNGELTNFAALTLGPNLGSPFTPGTSVSSQQGTTIPESTCVSVVQSGQVTSASAADTAYFADFNGDGLIDIVNDKYASIAVYDSSGGYSNNFERAVLQVNTGAGFTDDPSLGANAVDNGPGGFYTYAEDAVRPANAAGPTFIPTESWIGTVTAGPTSSNAHFRTRLHWRSSPGCSKTRRLRILPRRMRPR